MDRTPSSCVSGEQRVGLEVLLTGRALDDVDARGGGQRPCLGRESDHLLVQDDDTRLTSGIGRKLVGQAGEAHVEQAVQSLLEQVHHLGERDQRWRQTTN